jgi:hypothetical protein
MERCRRLWTRDPLASWAALCGAVSALVLYPVWSSHQHHAVAVRSPLTTLPAADARQTAAKSVVARDNPIVPVTAATASAPAMPRAPSPSGPASAQSGAAIKTAADIGRANPFEPLDAPAAPARPSAAAPGAPHAAIPALPPIPPLDPNSPVLDAAARVRAVPPPAISAAPAAAALRLVGFVKGQTALALIEEGGRSYLVAPRDLISPGLRVTAIDADRQVVRLDVHGAPVVLSIGSNPALP